MTDFPEALAAHLGRDVTTVCHCWRLTRTDGEVSGYTDHDQPLTVDATACAPQSGFSASEARDTLGLAVDTVDVEGALSADGIGEDDIAGGLYDGATVETFLVNWRNPADFVRLRSAIIGKIVLTDGRFVAELESPMIALDRPNGRYIARACDAELGDARCGFDLDQPGFFAAGSMAAALTRETFAATGLGEYAAGWFSAGTLTWTSGAAEGRAFRVAEHRRDGADVLLTLQTDAGPAVQGGDSFTLSAGCDKAFATCRSKFDNVLNFRGFPHLPGNDSGYAYVAPDGAFDGGALTP